MSPRINQCIRMHERLHTVAFFRAYSRIKKSLYIYYVKTAHCYLLKQRATTQENKLADNTTDGYNCFKYLF